MNITEYIKVSGDTTLSPYNLCPADVLVLTALSYIKFFSIVPSDFYERIKLSEAINRLLTFCLDAKHKDYLINLMNSKRFAGLYICGYRNEHSESDMTSMQFSAITIQLSDSLWFISYGGTDGTIVGWKEDFQLSYLQTIPAQEKALSYLKEVKNTINGNFILSGHSKGGNLAAYAAIYVDEDIQEHINSVFCNDSPGFKDESIFSQKGYQRIANKINSILPQNSIFGQLLRAFPKECQCVHSKSDSVLYQHDIFNWQINEDGALLLDSVNLSTSKIMKKINDFINNLTEDSRRILINDFFELLEKNQIKYLDNSFLKKLLHCIITR